MIPLNFHEFLVACAGSAASFIGLLFVGVSIVLQKTEGDQALSQHDRLLAQSAYLALINIFFISLSGLAPGTNIGLIMLVMGALSLVSSWRLGRMGSIPSLFFSSLLYLAETIFGFHALMQQNQEINIGIFQILVMFLFSLGLYRAWELTGVRANHKRM